MVHCPSCGAGLRFEIESQQMFCDHCQGRFGVKELYAKASDEAKTAQTYDSFAYICPSCGAELETTDPNDAVGFCQYCGGASMIFDKVRKEWKPNAIIPFKITKEQCKQLYCDHVKKYHFVSHKYRDPQLIESFRGIYIPYSCPEYKMSGTTVLYSRSNEKSQKKSSTYTIDYYNVTFDADITVKDSRFHDVSVSFDDHISEQIDPFDRRGERGFRPGYLSGFYAETGDALISDYAIHDEEELFKKVVEETERQPVVKDKMVENKIYAQPTSTLNSFPQMTQNQGYKALCPVWFMSYRKGNKITYAAVNGQTGKVAADLPLSPVRILLAALICAAAVFGVVFALFSLLPSLPANTTTSLTGFLGLAGMYVMQQSYINTVGNALHINDMKTGVTKSFFISGGVLLLSLILMSTDGSFRQSRYFLGNLLMIFLLLLIF